MVVVTSGAVPDWPGLQHEQHIIVLFLLLFPSVLLLPDIIRFSNLDAQTHQEPQKIHIEKHGNLNTSTHTQMGCLASLLICDASDFIILSSNIRCPN